MQDRRTDNRGFLSPFRTFPRSHFRSVTVGLGLSLLGMACGNKPPAVNPWRDDSISPTAWTTPSEQGILAAGHQPVIRGRDMPSVEVPLVAGDVPHYPLWWEDPFEDKGDEDGRFAWTWVDYLAMPYSYARMHLNTLAWPVSAVVTPPGTPMVSNGLVEPGREHDAKRGSSPNPSASPADFGSPDDGQTAPPSAEPKASSTTPPAT